jgi:hypothetical protein
LEAEESSPALASAWTQKHGPPGRIRVLSDQLLGTCSGIPYQHQSMDRIRRRNPTGINSNSERQNEEEKNLRPALKDHKSWK